MMNIDTPKKAKETKESKKMFNQIAELDTNNEVENKEETLDTKKKFSKKTLLDLIGEDVNEKTPVAYYADTLTLNKLKTLSTITNKSITKILDQLIPVMLEDIEVDMDKVKIYDQKNGTRGKKKKK